MRLALPEALFLLLLLPPLLWVLLRGHRRAEEVSRALKCNPPPGWHSVTRLVLVTVFLCSLVLIGAGPYFQRHNSGAYLFVNDVSRSMNARFVCDEATFLDRSKQVMRTVLKGIPEGKFGVLAFDRFAFPVSQMTYDHSYLDEMIENGLYVGLTYQATGTDLANALSVIADKKQKLPELYGNVTHAVLLSDGHIDGDYRRALRPGLDQLTEAQIRVVAVGIGNPGETPIPLREGRECNAEYIEVSGRRVTIPRRDDILRYISAETQGAYFEEDEGKSLVQYLRREGLIRVDDDIEVSTRQRQDIGWYFLISATVALFGLLFHQTNARWR
jgi:hypothetical protein